MQPNVRDVALEAAAAQLVRALGGKWSAGGAMCHCPAHDDATPSLSVRIGTRSLLFKCFAGCPTIEVLRAIRGRRLEIPTGKPVAQIDRALGTNVHMAERAAAIWRDAAMLYGTPGERYLAARGIFRPVPSLRFHHRTPIGRGRDARFRPAIIAEIRQQRRLVAVQRIFLSGDTPGLATDLPRPKLTLGRPLAGAVMLDPVGPVLGLAEGVETALSASILLGFPVWATLGNERLARIELPPIVNHLVLLPDADPAGRLAARRAQSAYARDGLDVETLWPWHGLNDWNDVLQVEGERGRPGCGWRPEGQGASHLETYP